jgi:predicted RND superfamily exporter protein
VSTDVIARVLALARRRRGWVLASTLAFSAVSALLCLRISFNGNVLNLLPHSSEPLQAFRRYLEDFGTADRLYILFEVPDGERVEEADDLIEAYLGRLQALPEIGRLDAGMFDAGKDWTYLQEREFVLIGPAKTESALALFEPAGMRAALERSRDLLSTPSPAVRDLIQTDPLGLLTLFRRHFASDATFRSLDMTSQGYVSADGRSRLVIATPTGAPYDSAFNHRLFAALAGVETAVRSPGPVGGPDAARDLRIEYAGGHRIALETEAIIRRESLFNGVTSLLAILIFLLVVFRSAWLFFVGAIPMTVATLGSVALNGLGRHELSAAATGTSALLFGLGIDGLVLLYTRYLEELESGCSSSDAVGRLAGPGTSMLLGCFTTAATFLGLTWIDLPGLQELGRLVGIGMLLGGPLTLILVAAMLPRTTRKPRALTADWLTRFVRMFQWRILLGAAILTIGAVPWLSRLHLDLRLQRLQPDTPAVRLQQDIGRRFGVDRDLTIVVAEGPEIEPLLALDRRFVDELAKTAPQLAGSGPSRLLPPADEQMRTSDLLRASATKVPAFQTHLRAAAFDVGFQPGAFDQFAARLPQLLNPDQRLTYEGYVQHGLTDLVSHFVARTGAGFMTVAYVEIGGADDLSKIRAAAAAAGPQLKVTGLPVVNAELAGRFRPQFAIGLLVGSAAVFLLMFATFKRLGLTLLALSPTVLGLIWSGAILAASGVELDLFSIFAILTLIGIGVDYGIHLVHRFSTEAGTLDHALTRIAPTNLVAAGIALLGCGSLVTSDYPPLRSLGIVTVVSLSTCLITAVIVLPALLMVLEKRSDHS